MLDDLATHDFPLLADELMDTIAAGPREGDETEVTERGGGGEGEAKRSLAQLSTRGPREGDETVPLEESPDTPPIHVD